MALNFEKLCQEGNEFLSEIQRSCDIDDREKAGRILKAVLHTLRDSLPVHESLHLISQLPLVIKGAYVEGWKLSEERHSPQNENEFYEQLRNSEMGTNFDFETDEEARQFLSGVLKVLSRHLSEGQVKHIVDVLPGGLKNLFAQGGR